MNLTGNTIFITGGGSGIGRGLAEELHKRGNKVIISGRRKSHLDAVAKSYPGIEAVELDIAAPDSIKAVAKKLITELPDLNVLINNAGIMEPDQAAGLIDDKLLVSTVTTNLLGPIRLTSALVEQLKSRRGVIVYNTSVLGFVPLALTAVYSATKAALHSYVLSQRFLLRESGVRVLEVAPPTPARLNAESSRRRVAHLREVRTRGVRHNSSSAIRAGRFLEAAEIPTMRVEKICFRTKIVVSGSSSPPLRSNSPPSSPSASSCGVRTANVT